VIVIFRNTGKFVCPEAGLVFGMFSVKVNAKIFVRQSSFKKNALLFGKKEQDEC